MKTRHAVACAGALTMSAVAAHAFCGFYVSGSDKKMFNDATNVVLVRDGTRTVLSMQNDYRGPLEDFAMVVPVPVVLKPTDVKVVPKAVLDRIDALGAPRLVEYWEQDPCPVPIAYDAFPTTTGAMAPRPAPPADLSVRSAAKRPSMDRDDAVTERSRPAVPPQLASFSVQPPTVTAGVKTPVTWSFAYANAPWPEPACTVDHGVGRVQSGVPKDLELQVSTTFQITCANAAGKSTKEARINVVKIEAQFDVAEYNILILSAAEAAGLDQWLKLNKYKIPDGAEALLRPYVESGSKFFVAKVDPKKVQMVDGHVALSPLRFHYDSDEFSLPIRLGMANSSGKQDLIVTVLSPDKRYEVANYKNVVIPTNFDVRPSVKGRFAEFYAALFDKTLEKNPGAVVTEYAWTSKAKPAGVYGVDCDPCPPEPPIDGDMMAVGADVIGGPMVHGGFVLTRLHARYGATDMKDDLRFREAKPITGGREVWSKTGLEYGANPGPESYFQARYAVRHWWTGPIRCEHPVRGQWGGPPDGRSNQVIAASKTAFAPRGKLQLAGVIKRDLWEIGFKKAAPPPPAVPPSGKKAMWFGGGALLALMALGLRRAIRRGTSTTAARR